MPLLVLFAFSAFAQDRKLGPETAKAIQKALLDPAFQTTKLDRIALLPFANAGQFKEASGTVSKNLVAQMSQFHPEYKVIAPDELMNFVTTSKMDDQFNIFLGDYLSAGTARQDFLQILRDKLQIDAALVGQIVAYGEVKTTTSKIPFPGGKKYLVGIEMALYRTGDARRIWYGKDSIDAKKPENLQQAAQIIGEVFARFLGRLPY
jgi:hypothetical protein